MLFLRGQNLAGEDILVVRGFNPLQNVITQLNVGDFFENFITEWLTPRARELGVAQILIPGGADGGSQTNQPDVSIYISGKYNASPVLLHDSPDMHFNEYDITGSCGAVRMFR